MSAFGVIFDIDKKEKEIAGLDEKVNRPDFWNDPDSAKTVLKEKSRLTSMVDAWRSTHSKIEDSRELFEMARNENDTEILAETDGEIDSLLEYMTSLEIRMMLSGEYDSGNAIVTVHPGAGGTESQDWAQMLLRMYLRFAEKQGFKTSIVDYQAGEEAGVKSVTFTVSGDYAYGYLKTENGVHRLVRISPFDANKRRHTSFASVMIIPELDDNVELEINEEDLKIDTYRASGAGGQHVNKTDSAVRITHIPTGTVVQCQSDRSQHKNRAGAMKVLRARLFELERRKKREKLDSLSGDKKDIAWGSQIRSYVLHPYRMIKDLRTRMESSNPDAVLDGDIMPFIEACLAGSGEGAAGKAAPAR